MRLQAETGNLLPVLALGYSDDLPRLAQAITAGAAGYLLVSDDPVLMQSGLRPFIQNKLLQEQALSALDAFNEIERLADDLRLVILPLGIAISAEKDFDRLLERILTQAMDICRADAGALYLRTAENELRVACARVISLDIAMGGTTGNAVTVGNVPCTTRWVSPTTKTSPPTSPWKPNRSTSTTSTAKAASTSRATSASIVNTTTSRSPA